MAIQPVAFCQGKIVWGAINSMRYLESHISVIVGEILDIAPFQEDPQVYKHMNDTVPTHWAWLDEFRNWHNFKNLRIFLDKVKLVLQIKLELSEIVDVKSMDVHSIAHLLFDDPHINLEARQTFSKAYEVLPASFRDDARIHKTIES